MFSRLSLLVSSIHILLLAAPSFTSALGTSCTAPLTTGTAAPQDPYWLETIKHQGISAFNPDPSTYQVFRNVKDFGATGDGVTDDTDAINAAMSTGDRCGGGTCGSSTITPAIVYFPPGTYLVSAPINTYYYTQMIGDAKRPPTLLADSSFEGKAVIDADPYMSNGSQWFINQNNFYRSVRNLIIDLRQMPTTAPAIGLHWQVSQATSLINVVVEMSKENGTQHQGLYMENGSGGFMGDIIFNGGMNGIYVGNQQFTVRNITVNDAVLLLSRGIGFLTAEQVGHGKGFQSTTARLASTLPLALGVSVRKQSLTAVVMDTEIFVSTTTPVNSSLGGSLILNNIVLHNVPVASWAQGNVYHGTDGQPVFTQGSIPGPVKPGNLLDSEGRIFGKSHPQYADYALDQIVSVRSMGATGDGVTDDTTALQKVFDELIFFDAGTYYITDTLIIPAGSQVAGEAWSVIMGGGSKFQDESKPKAVVQVGEACPSNFLGVNGVGGPDCLFGANSIFTPSGILEITDIVFTTRGPAPGAIVVEWNVHEPVGVQGGAGMWDSYIRIGGAAGTDLQLAECPAGSQSPNCMAAFMSLHLTQGSSAYLEGTWAWTADHDMEDPQLRQINVFTGRGVLSESLGPVWLIGTAEHAALYQYNLNGAESHWIGLAQTETPYYQPVPQAPAPYTINKKYADPTFEGTVGTAWAMYVQRSWSITLFGGGFYSFFQNYSTACLTNVSCQAQIFNVDDASTIQVYGFSTVGTDYQLSIDQKGIIDEASNPTGFQQSFAAWTRW
ncbi:glycoside hydrolase family 55 protein [Pisolithus orientalis]|uniref:glycoside hydrolase family 55 protein n=1 Tax=Pisolithus orientalis TaxID=936130 RepID=UPI002225A184|nr:glycoside hydrolase family 55 protein [Pisolithus orientalis]KAI5997793.1 glycoside hydrolase family 55 protein [Pisolithus orientalis]